MDAVSAYRTLELQFGASSDEVKRSWRRLVRVHHPDIGGKAATFLLIQEAYEFICNPRNAHLLRARSAQPTPSDFLDHLARAEAAMRRREAEMRAKRAREAQQARAAKEAARMKENSAYFSKAAYEKQLMEEKIKQFIGSLIDEQIGQTKFDDYA